EGGERGPGGPGARRDSHEPGAPGGPRAGLPDARAHLAARADAAGARGRAPRVGRGVAAACHEPGCLAAAGRAGGSGHRSLACEYAGARHAQARAECFRRYAGGRYAYAGRPAHGHIRPAPGLGYRAWHPNRAARQDFRAPVYHEAWGEWAWPLYCAGDCGSAWRHARGRERTRLRYNLYHDAPHCCWVRRELLMPLSGLLNVFVFPSIFASIYALRSLG